MPRYRPRRLTIAQLFTGAGVALLFVFIFGPLIWLMVWAFAGVWHYPALLPQQWSLSWWRQVFDYPQLARSVFLSFIFAPVVTALSAVVCLPAAYAFARFDVPGRRGLMIMLFSANAFPKIGLYITIATLFYALHLMGTFFGVVLIQLLGTIVFMTWIPTAAFAAVPRALEEAARDVGAGRLRTFSPSRCRWPPQGSWWLWSSPFWRRWTKRRAPSWLACQITSRCQYRCTRSSVTTRRKQRPFSQCCWQFPPSYCCF